MTTTPTFWGSEVVFSNDPLAFGPRVTGLADDTFAIVWEDGDALFGRHLDPLGSFTGGNFLSALPGAKPLGDPHIVQQADGKVIVIYGLTDGQTPLDRDIIWHNPNAAFTPLASTFPIENASKDELLIDVAARSDGVGGIGSAIAFQVAGTGSITYTVLRFVDPLGNQVSNQIFVGPHAGESQINAALAGRHTGHVVVAYDNVNLTTGAHQIRLHSYAVNETDTAGEVLVSANNVLASFPDVTALIDGSFVVTWQQADGISFRRYFAEGTALDAAPVHVPNSASGLVPKVTALKDGGFIIAWTAIVGTEADLSPELDVVMQRFGAAGNPIGTRVDIDSPGDQGLFGMSIATLADGRVILTYASETGDSTNLTTLNYRIVDPREPTILGTEKDDTIVGREDGSTISGLDGKDLLIGRAAADTLFGGADDDTLGGAAGDDSLDGGDGNDALDGGEGDDELDGGDGNDILDGGDGDDVLDGGAGDDALIGGDGNDVLDGADGNDSLRGDGDADTLRGSDGADTLNGGLGKDLLIGGKGKDSFVFDTALGKANRDVIDDFKPGKDQIHLSQAIFPEIGGKLGAKEFAIGKSAADKNDFVIYNENNGKLVHDGNGSKKGGHTLIAKLDKHLDLDHHDFMMIA